MSSSITPAGQKTVAVGLADLLALALAFVAMYAQTYDTLNTDIWSVVGQGHGPVIVALIGWLAWQRFPTLQACPDAGAPLWATMSLLAGLVLFVAGRSQSILMLEVVSQAFVLAGLLLTYKGTAGLKVMWFPLFFFIFLIPFPSSFVDAITAPLKQGVSFVAEWVLYKVGYPIGRSGVTITVGPYKLLVADACAGLNSIFALESIGIFYMSVMQYTSAWRNGLIALMVIPISFISNVARVIILVLITYHFGDEAGQGFVHGFAGILLFMIATALVIGFDSLLGIFLPDESRKKQHAN
jgi:exosortase B